MLQMFTYNEVAVLVRHWFEVSLEDSHLEHGVRVELRLLDRQPHRGSESASQKVLLDQPVWRADLFDRLDGVPGDFSAAHFHPRFDGVEPSERRWDSQLQANPWSWLAQQLCDVTGIVTAAGVELDDPLAESRRVCADAGEIVAAAQRRAAAECGSKEQCYDWTSDVTRAVHLMLGSLQRSDLLDRDRVSPWLHSAM